MGVLSITDRIRSRTLVLYRVAPDVVASFLPQPFVPARRGEHALLAICFTQMGDPRLAGWLPISFGTDHLSWRIAVQVPGEGDSPPRPAVWIARRHTSSWFSARAGRLSHGRSVHSEFRLDEGPSGTTLEVRTGGELDLFLRTERLGDLSGSVLFRDAEEVREALAANGPTHPPFALAPGFDRLDCARDRWRVEPLHVREIRAPRLEDPASFPAGTLELDCAVKLLNLCETTLPAAARRRFAPLEDTGPARALPT